MIGSLVAIYICLGILVGIFFTGGKYKYMRQVNREYTQLIVLCFPVYLILATLRYVIRKLIVILNFLFGAD